MAYATDIPVSTKQLNKVRELMKKQQVQDQRESAKVTPEQKIGDGVMGKSSTDDENEEEAEIGDLVGEEMNTCEVRDIHLEDGDKCQNGTNGSVSECSTPRCRTTQSSKPSERIEKNNSFRLRKRKLEESCGAQWDVFRRQDVPKLIEYLKRHSNDLSQVNGCRNHVSPGHNFIHC